MRRLFLAAALTACAAKTDKGSAITDGTPVVTLPAENLEVGFPADDGLMLQGILRLPDRIQSQPNRALVWVHGSGPHSRDAPMAGQLNLPRFPH